MQKRRTTQTLMLCLIALGMVLPSVALAGDVGRFGKSLRDNKDGPSSPSDSSSDDDDSSWDDDDDTWDDGDSWGGDDWGDAFGACFGLALQGFVPGKAFTFGEGPYVGRRVIPEESEEDSMWVSVADHEAASAASAVSLQASDTSPSASPEEPEPVTGEFVLQSHVIGTTSLDGMGLGVSARIGSTFTPSLEIEGMSINDIEDAGATLQMGTALVEPNIALFDQGRVYWGLGASYFGDREGTIGWAFAMRLGADLYLYEPFSLRVKGGAHLIGEAVVWDGSVNLGLQASNSIFIEAGVRALAIEGGETLTIPMIGMAWNFGF